MKKIYYIKEIVICNEDENGDEDDEDKEKENGVVKRIEDFYQTRTR